MQIVKGFISRIVNSQKGSDNLEYETTGNKETLEEFVLKQVRSNGLKIKGPVETAYGWGWNPTTTYWNGNRRVHFYDDGWLGKPENIYIEVSSVHPKRVLKALVQDNTAVWEAVLSFLSEEGSFDQLPDLGWSETKSDHDKFIPHPPDDENPWNLTQVIGNIKTKGASRWKPRRH